MLQRDFILGEKKYVKFKATSCDGRPVIITNATFGLTKDGKLMANGICEINADEFMAFVEPPSIGDFVLEITYTIAPETRKVRVAIHVT